MTAQELATLVAEHKAHPSGETFAALWTAIHEYRRDGLT
jgi:hypothetical protein